MRAKAGFSIASFSALIVLLCAGSGLQAQASMQDSANELPLAVGKTVLVDTARPIARVAIGSAEVAEASVVTRTEVMVNGKAAGETSLIIWDKNGGRQFFNVVVRASAAAVNDSLDSVRREIRTELPGQNLKITSENGSVFLRGTVKDLASAERAAKIAASMGKVVNLLEVNVPAPDPQIMLKVRFASIDRSKSKQLGINIFSLGAANTVGGITTGQFSPPTITRTPGSVTTTSSSTVVTPPTNTATFTNELNLLALAPGNLPLGVDIEALEATGVVEVLAQPNLIATNGKQASFLAGGEYPYPVIQGGGSGTSNPTVTIQFKEYGIRLNFLPTMTPRGTVKLQVAPEVSSLDFTNAVEVSGFTIPAIATRKVKTEVELKEGQSFVIGGLLDNRETETFQKIPFLGDIPVLGRFFQSMSRNKTNTELVVIVTPVYVTPIPEGAPLPELKQPEKFLPANSGIPMSNPETKPAGYVPPPAPETMPVEKLIESMKPAPPLTIEGDKGTFGGSSSTGAGANTTGGATPQ